MSDCTCIPQSLSFTVSVTFFPVVLLAWFSMHQVEAQLLPLCNIDVLEVCYEEPLAALQDFLPEAEEPLYALFDILSFDPTSLSVNLRDECQ